ncbi:MAG: DUF2812 domain-containing protein [Acholeplasmataceae bacterium]|nr:DUF2812 domain-containing protein [Acholeplasmataceae bacterium]
MNPKKRRIVRLFWLWRETDELAWLHQMSLRGWHLIHVRFLIYTFKKGEPKDLIYHWDILPSSKEDHAELIEAFETAGWHHLSTYGSTSYFQTPATNPYKDAYTNNQSKSTKVKTLLLMHIILIPMIMAPMLILSKAMETNASPLIISLIVLNVLVMIFMIYSTFKLMHAVSRFNHAIKE